jgi:hypothetical protein
MEGYYAADLAEKEKKIKYSFYTRAAVLALLAVLQVFVFAKLVEDKLAQIRNIIIGPQ